MRSSMPRHRSSIPKGGKPPASLFNEATYQASMTRRGMPARPIAPQSVPALPAPGQTQAAIDLAHLALTQDTPAIALQVQRHAAGQTLESICFGLLAPAARHLGALWEDDRCSFADVTIGLLGLQQALRALAPACAPPRPEAAAPHHILLAPAPGNQHGLGLGMLQNFFERAGWQVATGIGCQPESLIDQVRRHHFGVVGLSVGTLAQAESLPGFLTQLRRASRNPGLGIMVGGFPFLSDSGLARRIGADATATDALQAVGQAENLLGRWPGAV